MLGLRWISLVRRGAMWAKNRIWRGAPGIRDPRAALAARRVRAR
jgi:hypothetical protein